jgi:hypothetical protein
VRLGCGKCFSLCVRFLRILCLSPAATVASPWALELLRYIRLFRREKEAFSLPLTTHVFQSSLSVPCQRDWRLKKKNKQLREQQQRTQKPTTTLPFPVVTRTFFLFFFLFLLPPSLVSFSVQSPLLRASTLAVSVFLVVAVLRCAFWNRKEL